eukprot:804267-Pelagomonas_calceolata.AAC.1
MRAVPRVCWPRCWGRVLNFSRSSSISKPRSRSRLIPVNKQQGRRSSDSQSTPALQYSAPAPSSPSSRSSSTEQNTGEAVEKGQGASTDKDSRARARKIAQAIKATWGPPWGYVTFGNISGLQFMGMGLQFSDFHLGVI